MATEALNTLERLATASGNAALEGLVWNLQIIRLAFRECRTMADWCNAKTQFDTAVTACLTNSAVAYARMNIMNKEVYRLWTAWDAVHETVLAEAMDAAASLRRRAAPPSLLSRLVAALRA
jgi:hypothetical protein